jgi:hypothetical protein
MQGSGPGRHGDEPISRAGGNQLNDTSGQIWRVGIDIGGTFTDIVALSATRFMR